MNIRYRKDSAKLLPRRGIRSICFLGVSLSILAQAQTKVIEPTTVSSERVQELRSHLSELVTAGLIPPRTLEDVEANDATRYGNLYAFCPSFVERSTIMVDFVSTLRPQAENDILVKWGTDAIACVRVGEKCLRLQRLFGTSLRRFFTNDARLFEIARHVIHEALVTADSRELELLSDVIKFIGVIRIPEAGEFLQKATGKSFWNESCAGLDTAPELGSDYVERFRRAAMRGVLDLPPEMSIPILEDLLGKMTKSDFSYQRVYRYLDEAWKRRKGEPRFEYYRLRYDYLDPPTNLPHPYPEWLYGPGGSRIEWPFGKSPEGYVHRPMLIEW